MVEARACPIAQRRWTGRRAPRTRTCMQVATTTPLNCRPSRKKSWLRKRHNPSSANQPRSADGGSTTPDLYQDSRSNGGLASISRAIAKITGSSGSSPACRLSRRYAAPKLKATCASTSAAYTAARPSLSLSSLSPRPPLSLPAAFSGGLATAICAGFAAICYSRAADPAEAASSPPLGPQPPTACRPGAALLG